MLRTTSLALAILTAALHAQAPSSASGAWSTGAYRDLFAERGHSPAQIDAKVEETFRELFFGDSATRRVYRVQPDTTLALVESAGYVASPDMGAALLIAVMMDRPDLFRKLWKFARSEMQNTVGSRQGYFAWLVAAAPPYDPVDLNPSPDGDETIATALFLASRRWKDQAEAADYQARADELLASLIRGGRGERMSSLVDTVRKQIVFAPTQSDSLYTAPGYHMPAFYRLWSLFATANRDFWGEMADSSYALLRRAEHPVTGLFPSLSTFDGSPRLARVYPQPGDLGKTWYADTVFAADAYRVGAHLALDWEWFRSDAWAVDHVRRQLGFFAGLPGRAKAKYTLAGAPLDSLGSASLTAGNAVAALASDRESDGRFVDSLWNAPIPTGDERFASGLVRMLALLQASGRFVAYGSPGAAIGIQARPDRASFSVRRIGACLQVEGVRGLVRLLDARGREGARAHSTGSVTLSAPRPGLWIVDAGASGRLRILVAP